MLSLIIFLFILGILIVVHEFGHLIAAKKVGVRVERFSLGFGPQLASRKIKDTEYTISAIPLGGYVKLAGDNLEEFKGKSDEYFSKAPGKRFWIIFCGPLLNYILGIVCFWIVFTAGFPALTTKVGGLLDDFGAKKAGIQVGDVIKSFNGKPVSLWEDLQVMVQKDKTAKTASVVIERNQKEFTLNVEIKERKMDDIFGRSRSIGLLGLSPADDFKKVRYGAAQSISLSLNKTWNLTTLTYHALARMILGKMSFKETTGPLGIFFITAKVAPQGIIAILNFIGLISVSLALFNVLPLPVLDGGHILLLAIEKIRGKCISVKTEQIITNAGLSLIIFFALFVTYNDIVRFFGDKISRLFAK